MQSIDQRYNIRGWLTHINNSTLTNDGVNNNDANDLFGMELVYNQEQLNVNGNSTKLYNGNISAVRWKWNNQEDTPVEKAFKFDYDTWSRMEESYYAHKAGSSWTGSSGGFNEQMTYDKNGNIASLSRTGNIGGANQTIDQLAYKYNGNRLTNVHDNSGFYNANDKNPDYGFSEVIHDVNLTEYQYDANGNLFGDANKGITSITYNHLNMPERIELESNYAIEYTYDASGNKLRKIAKIGSTEISRTDYVGSIHYVDNQLAFLLTDHGRVVKRNTGYDYEYFLKDHQGNTRVVFGNIQQTDVFKATLETERNTEEVADFKNISRTAGYNRTPKNYETPNPQYAAAISGGVGPAKIISVKEGDKLHLEVFARYTGSVTSSKITAAALASAVTSAFQVFPTGETQIAHNAVNSGVLASPANENSGAPKAYLYYFLFSADYSWYQVGFSTMTTAASLSFEKRELDVTVDFPVGVTDGFIYTYVANETIGTPVHFDDFKIIHEKVVVALEVLQASDYYPFGLAIPALSYERETVDMAKARNNYTFQGQEIQGDFNLDWYHYKYRMHDPAIGRFGAVDPLAEKYMYNSTYAFSENRLVDGVELEGLEVQTGVAMWDYMMYNTNYGYHVYQNQFEWDGGIFTGLVDWMLTPAVDALQGPINNKMNDYRYEHNQNEYNPEIPQDIKDLNHTLVDLKTTTQTIDGWTGVINQATFLQGLAMGGLEGTLQSSLFRTPRFAINGAAKGESKYLYHYTSEASAKNISKVGLSTEYSADGFIYLTNKANLSPLQAQIELALPAGRNLPTSILRIDASGLNPALISRVQGNLPGLGAGGGTEFLFNQNIPAHLIKIVK